MQGCWRKEITCWVSCNSLPSLVLRCLQGGTRASLLIYFVSLHSLKIWRRKRKSDHYISLCAGEGTWCRVCCVVSFLLLCLSFWLLGFIPETNKKTAFLFFLFFFLFFFGGWWWWWWWWLGLASYNDFFYLRVVHFEEKNVDYIFLLSFNRYQEDNRLSFVF